MSNHLAFIDDDLNIAVRDRAAFTAAKEKFAGQDVIVSISRVPKRQGTQALRYLRGPVIKAIAEASGVNDPDDYESVYQAVMWKLFPLPPGKFGEPRRESCAKDKMSQERLSEVISRIIEWAHTNIVGCRIPAPDEIDFELEVDPEYDEGVSVPA